VSRRVSPGNFETRVRLRGYVSLPRAFPVGRGGASSCVRPLSAKRSRRGGAHPVGPCGRTAAPISGRRLRHLLGDPPPRPCLWIKCSTRPFPQPASTCPNTAPYARRQLKEKLWTIPLTSGSSIWSWLLFTSRTVVQNRAQRFSMVLTRLVILASRVGSAVAPEARPRVRPISSPTSRRRIIPPFGIASTP